MGKGRKAEEVLEGLSDLPSPSHQSRTSRISLPVGEGPSSVLDQSVGSEATQGQKLGWLCVA